jgi:diacylglycerol kinase
MWRKLLLLDHFRKLPFVWSGFVESFRTSSGFRIHLYADIFAFILVGIFTISLSNWALLVIAYGMKASAEPFNSTFENIVRKVFGSHINEDARINKDLPASGVFHTVIVSVVIWSVVFIPEFQSLIEKTI